mmetsp:Transcript_58337/g.92619  ORF Transcript_58337/g.92619 Transcript_58337/m.92619 type:complete len:117 (-) Transcript_58337:172-522(-)
MFKSLCANWCGKVEYGCDGHAHFMAFWNSLTKKERKQESDLAWERFLKLCDDAICGVHQELERLAGQYAAKLAESEVSQPKHTEAKGTNGTTDMPLELKLVARPLHTATRGRSSPY